ncbi:unnamed protein product [Diamesa serratosioi]
MPTHQLISNLLMKELRWSIFFKTTTLSIKNFSDENKNVRVYNYLFFVKTQSDLNSIMNVVTNTSSWSPHANVLLYIDRGDDEWRELVGNFFKTFWKYWLLNVSIMVPDPVTYVQNIFTAFPYARGNCEGNQDHFLQLGICQDAKIIPQGVNIFPVKVPANMNGCTVKIATLIYPPYILPVQNGQNWGNNVNITNGIEIQIIKAIAKQANFAAQFHVLDESENWGQIFPHNSTGTGMMSAFLKHQTDIAVGSLKPNLERHTVFDYTVQYMQDATVWVVSVADKIPNWRKIFLVFTPTVWAMSAIVYLLSSILVYFLGLVALKNNQMEHALYRSFSGAFFATYGVFMVNSTGSARTIRLRSFLIFWSLFCIHWYTAYTTSLVSLMTSPMYVEQLESFKDMKRSEFRFGMTLPTTKYFQSHHDEIGNVVLANVQLCSSSLKCLHQLTKEKKFAVAISREYLEYVINKFKDEEGKPLIRALDDTIVQTPIEMLLFKGNPLLNRFNDLLLRIVEAGLIIVWTKQIQSDVFRQSDKLAITNEHLPLSLLHLQGAFFLLVFGLIVSFVCFIFQVLYYKLQIHNLHAK